MTTCYCDGPGHNPNTHAERAARTNSPPKLTAPSPGVPEIRDNRDEPDRSALTLQPGSDHLLDTTERG